MQRERVITCRERERFSRRLQRERERERDMRRLQRERDRLQRERERVNTGCRERDNESELAQVAEREIARESSCRLQRER